MIVVFALAAVALALVLAISSLRPPPMSVPPRVDAIVSGVTLIQPGVGRLPDQTIVVRDGRLHAVRPRRAGDPAAPFEPAWVVPGLIDVHVHTPPRVALGGQTLFSLLHLAHGVTTVRDVGASDGSLPALARRLAKGALPGPRLLTCGPVLDGSPPGWPSATVVADAAEGTAVVDRLAAAGVDCIKVYNELGAPAFAAIAAAAERHGLPLVGHVPHAVGLSGVVDFEAQHLTGVPYLAHPRPPLGWDVRDADLLALSDADIEQALDVAASNGIRFTPTLANFRLRLSASDPQRFPPPTAARWLPRYWGGVWDVLAGHPSSQEAIEARLRALDVLREIVSRAHARGLDVLAGTDTIMPWVVPGDALHRELAALRDALGDAEAALAAATTVPGRHLGGGRIGVLRVGAEADFLVLPADPTVSLDALRDWRVLYASGRRYERATVDRWVEDAAAHFRGGLHGRLVDPLVSTVAGAFGHANAGGGSAPEAR